MTKLDWRKIETELVDIARGIGLVLDEDKLGDKVYYTNVLENEDIGVISLTSLAKELAERLK